MAVRQALNTSIQWDTGFGYGYGNLSESCQDTGFGYGYGNLSESCQDTGFGYGYGNLSGSCQDTGFGYGYGNLSGSCQDTDFGYGCGNLSGSCQDTGRHTDTAKQRLTLWTLASNTGRKPPEANSTAWGQLVQGHLLCGGLWRDKDLVRS
ncbi:hypothetical protein STEG23_015959 [Scotinomys teguina]